MDLETQDADVDVYEIKLYCVHHNIHRSIIFSQSG